MLIHENDIDYKTQAEKYVLNMIREGKKGGKWTLHIKNTKNCHWSKLLFNYADFDALKEVEKWQAFYKM